jgi:hypothetical protein
VTEYKFDDLFFMQLQSFLESLMFMILNKQDYHTILNLSHPTSNLAFTSFNSVEEYRIGSDQLSICYDYSDWH